MKFLKWFYPGMGIKRWWFLILLGMLLFVNGLLLLINLRLDQYTDTLIAWALSVGIPIRVLYGGMLVGGLLFTLLGMWGWLRSILSAVKPDNQDSLVDVVYQQRALRRGMKIVAVGGGTGLSTLLRGLKEYTSNIVAVVAVSDDGGSSGRLRKELGVLPPGDIRNCLASLANSELLGELLQYRFEEGDGLEGHSFGNLFLVAMSGITGDFLRAVKASSNVLAVRGTVLPATLEPVTLCAELEDGSIVEGETSLSKKGKSIRRLFLRPRNPKPLDEVLQAIKEADAIVLGPGSLYTSIMPNLLVSKMAETIRNASAVKIFVCNCMTQPGETDHFTASQHLLALERQFGKGLVEYALVNTFRPSKEMEAKYRQTGAEFVEPDVEAIKAMGITPIALPLINESDVVRHDSKQLAMAIMRVIMEGLYKPMSKPSQNGKSINLEIQEAKNLND
jgi:uncharacterized cofD-like protein